MMIFDTREELLSLVPSNAVIAELGVYKGDFSKIIYNLCNPKELVLIDVWELNSMEIIDCGDKNGNNTEYIKAIDLWNTVHNEFNDKQNVKLIKDYTSKIAEFPEDYFDMIYIDADHSYNGCYSDLINSYEPIKDGGWIMGHDYGQNFNKVKYDYNFSAKRAVDDFCKLYHQEIFAIGNDGCISFAIKVKK
jgi:hypothetical protein